MLVFWTLILFGSWTGIPGGAPVPAWMPVLSTITTVWLAVPLLTVAVILYGARSRNPESGLSSSSSPASIPNLHLPFVRFGMGAWLIAGAMGIAGALPVVNPFIRFTWFAIAQSQLNTYGFFALTMFGAIYAIVPSVTGVAWPRPGMVRAQFRCAAVGILLLVVPLAIGGVVQGTRLNDPRIVASMDLTRPTLPYLRVSTLGNALIFLSNLLLLTNLLGVWVRYGRRILVPAYRAMIVAQPATESAALAGTEKAAGGL